MKRKIIYYKDEINDDFSGVKRKTIKIDRNYNYIKRNALWRLCSFFLYRVVMKPFAWLYMKIKYNHIIKNKSVLRRYKDKGYFVYSNHVLIDGDAFVPNLIDFNKKTYIVVHPDNLSVPITKTFLEMNGAFPLPATIEAGKNFLIAMKEFLGRNSMITIFPEAHIWPYYNRIRPFPSGSFKYPIKFDKPVYVITNTLHKRIFLKMPRVITFVDGPFFVDKSLNKKDQVEDLRNKVYEVMCERSKNGNYQYIEYIKEN